MAAMNTMLAARAQPTTIGHTNRQTDKTVNSHIHDVEVQCQCQRQCQCQCQFQLFIVIDALMCGAFSECLDM